MGKLARLIIQPQDVLYDLLGVFQPQIGSWYPSIYAHIWGGSTYIDIPANTLRALYYPVFRKTRFDRVGIYIAGAGATGARVRAGIYDDKDFYPNSLLLDAGEIVADATAERSVAIDITLDAGRYWLVCNTNDPTIDLKYPVIFLPLDSVHVGHFAVGYYILQTYGALPSSFPTGATKTGRYTVEMHLRVKEVL